MKIVSSSMISVGLMTVLIVLLIQASGGFAFLASPTLPCQSKPYRYPYPPEYSSLFSSVAVSVDELEKDLTPAEKSITSVVRKCGPSVAYVTSVWPTPTATSAANGSSSRKRKEGEGQNGRPSGRELGSGSGFQVSSDGYICTNYHVVERAYTIQQAYSNFETMIQQIAGNVTTFLPKDLVDSVLQSTMTSLNNNSAPVVSVRINSETQYQTCRIVSVEPDLDLALLKVESPAADDNKSFISFGSSSELLVGQSVVAIGNPFALDKTVTTGVVSAVNREFRGAGGNTARTPANTPIRNCIQTDAAINPGNSGGPLLNLRGQVVGINTAIITTSGSNAGIGFAVPSDQLQPVVDRMIQKDRMTSRRDVGWLGINIAKQPIHKSTTKVYVAEVAKGSPAKFAGIQPLQIQTNGSIKLGDAIVAVSGNEVTSLDELQAQLKNRVEGEQISLTLENSAGEKRVVYIKLGQKP
eukprot:scaffold1586_cov88-Cylindrotheca_fusiformis.AAC.2